MMVQTNQNPEMEYKQHHNQVMTKTFTKQTPTTCRYAHTAKLARCMVVGAPQSVMKGHHFGTVNDDDGSLC